MMGGMRDDVLVYNVSQSAYYFPSISKHFTAITGEFPDSDTIIIEIGTTEFSAAELLDALEQVEYDEAQNGNKITASLSSFTKLKMFIKESAPLLQLANKQRKLIFKDNAGKDDSETKDRSLTAYTQALNSVCAALTQIYDGRIIIMYHPTVTIEPNGKMSINTNETDCIFAQVCADNGIEFVDMADSFLSAYEKDYSVPYGFHNTSIGSGHLNAAGHRLIAEKLYKVLMGGEAK